MEAPYGVVITGSTKGVGKALAFEHLEAGDTVIISSRSKTAVASTVEELSDRYGTDRVMGLAADVTKPGDVKALVQYASDSLGGAIDLWINNAGSNAYVFKPLMETEDDDLVNIVQTNLLGVMLCCREVISVMKDQKHGGHVFTMDGAGADGLATPDFAAYGATKRSLEQLSKSLQAELKASGVKGVGVHNLSPGMVTTELLMSGADRPNAAFFINCLAEEPAMVAAYLVPRIRRVPQESATLGGGVSQQYIRFLTKPNAYLQIFKRLLLGDRKDRFVSED